jgi:hypothetical protein
MFEWQPLSALKKCTIGTYWKNLGDALDIDYGSLPSGKIGFRDGLHFIDEVTEWSHQYKAKQMKT